MSADVVSALVAAGMSEAAAQGKAALFAAAAKALGAVPAQRWFVPGRIEVLGKHTDYAGGRSLVCAAERGMCVAVAPRSDALVRVVDAVRKQVAEFHLSPELEVTPGWANYATAAARRIARNFPGQLRGAEISIATDLPPSAGMSSSSVLVIAIFTALAAVNRLAERDEYKANIARPEDLAEYLACIENGQTFGSLAGDRGVGTFGGSEDHTAILCSAAGMLSQYRFCPVKLERRLHLPNGYGFAIAASGVAASKTGAARESYNRASHAAGAVLRIWNMASGRNDPTLYTAVMHAPDAPERIRDALAKHTDPDFEPDLLRRRFDQFFLESQAAVPAGGAALTMGALESFGKIADCSQSAAERLLGNQVPETIELARSARELGACAASAFGAGFGGSVWALVPTSEAPRFMNTWRTHYQLRFPEAAARAQFFFTGAGPALREMV